MGQGRKAQRRGKGVLKCGASEKDGGNNEVKREKLLIVGERGQNSVHSVEGGKGFRGLINWGAVLLTFSNGGRALILFCVSPLHPPVTDFLLLLFPCFLAPCNRIAPSLASAPLWSGVFAIFQF